jgi:hypothetical protein
MNADTSLRLFDLTFEFIKDKDKAKDFVFKIEQTIDTKFKDEKDYLASKQDVLELKSEILKWLIALFVPFYIGMIVFLIKNFI